ARTAWQYALAVSMWLVFTPDELQRTRIGAAPSPEEVLLWYHLRIYMKVVRAIAADEAGAGRAVAEETSGLGKLTLVCIERSRKALRQMKTRTDPATIVPLEGMLDTLEREIEA